MTETDHNPAAVNRPRLRTLEAASGERHASWLELFFDLVFVLAVAQTAKILASDSDFDGTLRFAALFVPVWWSWIGFTFYADRFETEETVYRVLMFAGMFAVACLSLTLGNAFSGAGDAPFVFCYVAVRFIIIALYARSAYYIPVARRLCLHYVAGFGFAAAVWLASLLLPPPLRYAVWALAVAVELIAPLVNARNINIIPFDRSHIPERFGLFTIIVLGEAVVATANGVGQTVWTIPTLATAGLGFAMAASIWWINFDFVEDTAIKSNALAPRFVYLYGHFFIVASIVALGIGVEHAITEIGANEAHLHTPTLALLGGGIAVYFAVITIIKLVTHNCNLLAARSISIVVAVSLIFLGALLPPLAAVAAFLALLAVGVWLESRFSANNAAENTEETAGHLAPCAHAGEMRIFEPRAADGCEECLKNNYKWVHLRLCLVCGHVGCCDSSQYKHATGHFHESRHAVMASLEPDEAWAWCYVDKRFVPSAEPVGIAAARRVE